MEQRLSLAEINEKIDAIKGEIDSKAGTNFGYTIKFTDTTFGKERELSSAHTLNMSAGEDKRAICDKFKKEIDGLTRNPSIASIHVIICGKKRDDIVFDEEVSLISKYQGGVAVIESNEKPQQQPQPQPQPQAPNPQLDTFGQVSNILGLLGFGGLAGTNDGTNGLNAILQVRDGLNEQRHAYEKKDEKMTEMAANLARAEMERDQLKQDKEKLQHQIEKRDERIEELEIELDEKDEQIRRLHPEFSIAGTSLTALGTAIVKGFAMKHANTIGSLAGIDGDTLRTMLDKDEQALPANEEEADDNSDGRAEQFKMIRDFIKTLNDKEFDDFWQLMRVFAANKDTIAIVLAMAKGGNEPQPNDVVEQE